MKLLFTLAVSNHDSARAEKLLDFIHHHGGKLGHLVLGLLSDVHDEMKARLRISASLAFEVVHEVELRPLTDRQAPKSVQANNMFRQMAVHIQTVFAWPFLWMEADCTPTVKDWRERLWSAFDAQPMAFLGNKLRLKPKKDGDSELLFMGRVGIYPRDAHSKMMISSDNPVPVEILAGKYVLPQMAITKLIQLANIQSEGDLIKVRDDAILVHGDKKDFLLQQLCDAAPKAEPVKIHVTDAPEVIPAPEAPEKPRLTRRMMREMANGATK